MLSFFILTFSFVRMDFVQVKKEAAAKKAAEEAAVVTAALKAAAAALKKAAEEAAAAKRKAAAAAKKAAEEASATKREAVAAKRKEAEEATAAKRKAAAAKKITCWPYSLIIIENLLYSSCVLGVKLYRSPSFPPVRLNSPGRLLFCTAAAAFGSGPFLSPYILKYCEQTRM